MLAALANRAAPLPTSARRCFATARLGASTPGHRSRQAALSPGHGGSQGGSPEDGTSRRAGRGSLVHEAPLVLGVGEAEQVTPFVGDDRAVDLPGAGRPVAAVEPDAAAPNLGPRRDVSVRIVVKGRVHRYLLPVGPGTGGRGLAPMRCGNLEVAGERLTRERGAVIGPSGCCRGTCRESAGEYERIDVASEPRHRESLLKRVP